MEPRISIITLGVSDLARSTQFYRDGLGFPVHDAGGDEITFFEMNGIMLALYSRDDLADDANMPEHKGTPQPDLHGFTIAHNVASRDEVDAVLRLAESAGRSHRQARPRHVLGRLRRLLCGPGRLPLGSGHRRRPAC